MWYKRKNDFALSFYRQDTEAPENHSLLWCQKCKRNLMLRISASPHNSHDQLLLPHRESIFSYQCTPHKVHYQQLPAAGRNCNL